MDGKVTFEIAEGKAGFVAGDVFRFCITRGTRCEIGCELEAEVLPAAAALLPGVWYRPRRAVSAAASARSENDPAWRFFRRFGIINADGVLGNPSVNDTSLIRFVVYVPVEGTRVYDYDAPGFPDHFEGDDVAIRLRANFTASVDVLFDRSGTLNDRDHGEKCSNDFLWHLNFHVIKDDDGKMRFDPNEVSSIEEGHQTITIP